MNNDFVNVVYGMSIYIIIGLWISLIFFVFDLWEMESDVEITISSLMWPALLVCVLGKITYMIAIKIKSRKG